jgi:hypothetical protein
MGRADCANVTRSHELPDAIEGLRYIRTSIVNSRQDVAVGVDSAC